MLFYLQIWPVVHSDFHSPLPFLVAVRLGSSELIMICQIHCVCSSYRTWRPFPPDIMPRVGGSNVALLCTQIRRDDG